MRMRSRLFFANMSTVVRRALLILARGAEEMEAVISADVMRRGGVSGRVRCSRIRAN